MATSSAIDFDYMEVENEDVAELLGRLFEYCRPRGGFEVPANPADRIRIDMETANLLKECRAKGLTVAGGTYERTNHEVDDDFENMPVILAQWDETCLVLRIGTDGTLVERADVEARMGKWTNTSDPRIVRPAISADVAFDDSDLPF